MRSTIKMDLLKCTFEETNEEPSLKNKVKVIKIVEEAVRKYEWWNKSQKKQINEMKRDNAVQTIIDLSNDTWKNFVTRKLNGMYTNQLWKECWQVYLFNSHISLQHQGFVQIKMTESTLFFFFLPG